MDNSNSVELIFKACISLQKELLLSYKDGFTNEEELLSWSNDLSKMKVIIDNVRELAEIDYYNKL